MNIHQSVSAEMLEKFLSLVHSGSVSDDDLQAMVHYIENRSSGATHPYKTIRKSNFFVSGSNGYVTLDVDKKVNLHYL
ncbi:MAG: hypothetical protein LRY41_01880 [Candidatus Pacebacteria bacterium]|nr:hypothetical protein [Candidatus Paceibacterota bacterium]MCD8507799.1 hypothetical protein [Candidatus Paceibacterota bacterium]MCD8528059.1 hypothetical protein [Candidatus Paceibacterota bacterium]MCD8563868.1 hypothetical protein [Candidatus Paceibacterota bacterium]